MVARGLIHQQDVVTLGIRTVLVVNKDVEEELVYVMTRVMFENKDDDFRVS